jgi:hypothetical protein
MFKRKKNNTFRNTLLGAAGLAGLAGLGYLGLKNKKIPKNLPKAPVDDSFKFTNKTEYVPVKKNPNRKSITDLIDEYTKSTTNEFLETLKNTQKGLNELSEGLNPKSSSKEENVIQMKLPKNSLYRKLMEEATDIKNRVPSVSSKKPVGYNYQKPLAIKYAGRIDGTTIGEALLDNKKNYLSNKFKKGRRKYTKNDYKKSLNARKIFFPHILPNYIESNSLTKNNLLKKNKALKTEAIKKRKRLLTDSFYKHGLRHVYVDPSSSKKHLAMQLKGLSKQDLDSIVDDAVRSNPKFSSIILLSEFTIS